MIQYDQFEILSQNRFDNNDAMIEFSPYQTDVWVKRFKLPAGAVEPDKSRGIDGDPFGYNVGPRSLRPIVTPGKPETDLFDFQTKCVIQYTQERRFLKSVNIFWDESKGDTLPIVGFFYDRDDLQREDILLLDLHDIGSGQKHNTVTRKLKVVDIKTKGNMYNFMKIYHLAPYRDQL